MARCARVIKPGGVPPLLPRGGGGGSASAERGGVHRKEPSARGAAAGPTIASGGAKGSSGCWENSSVCERSVKAQKTTTTNTECAYVRTYLRT